MTSMVGKCAATSGLAMRQERQLTHKGKMAQQLTRRTVLLGTALVAASGATWLGWRMRSNPLKNQEPEVNQRLAQRLSLLGARLGDPIFIRLFKLSSNLELWVQPGGTGPFVKFHDYPICAFSGELGPKEQEGDHQAPEGFYRVEASQLNPNSRHHRSFNLGYPNAFDRSHGRTGSYLMIHGGCSSVGCYAMTDASIAEIYALAATYLTRAPRAQEKSPHIFQVHAFPFVLSDQALATFGQKYPQWHSFWRDLQKGYLAFNRTQYPPIITVENQRYVVEAKG